MVSFENRVILSGFGVAFVGVAVLVALEYLGFGLVTSVIGPWFLIAGIAAPQLYLAARGEEPRGHRRLLAAFVVGYVAWSTLSPAVGEAVAAGAGVAVVLVAIGYEVYLGHREGVAPLEPRSEVGRRRR